MIKRYKFKGLHFWAERGLIHIEDQKDGSYSTISRKEALLRAKAINDEINGVVYGDEREQIHSLIQNMIDCVKEAKEQGDPMNVDVLNYKIKEIKNARRAKLLLPNMADVPIVKNPAVNLI